MVLDKYFARAYLVAMTRTIEMTKMVSNTTTTVIRCNQASSSTIFCWTRTNLYGLRSGSGMNMNRRSSVRQSGSGHFHTVIAQDATFLNKVMMTAL